MESLEPNNESARLSWDLANQILGAEATSQDHSDSASSPAHPRSSPSRNSGSESYSHAREPATTGNGGTAAPAFARNPFVGISEPGPLRCDSLQESIPNEANVDRRELHKQHVYMIAIGAVLGMGFYYRTGDILQLGGTAAVVYSFGFLSVLGLMVMQDLARLLQIWPVAGALIIYVKKFVDEEIGTAVGILYWYGVLLPLCNPWPSIAILFGHSFPRSGIG
jgi:amino acid permease